MIWRMTFCSAQASLMRWRRLGPMPSTSSSRADSCSMMSKIFSPNFAHELLGVNGADALDHAAAQIFLDALLSRGRGAVEHLGAELEAKLFVLDPAAFGGQPFPGADGSQGADHGDEVTVPFGLHLEHGPAVVLVEEGDALDQTGEAFVGSC